MSAEQQKETAEVEITNVGGIDNTSATLRPGVTVLEGRNATNRTSFLEGVMAALGSDNLSIKGDAEEATATLTIGDTTYTRTLTRTNGTVTTTGEPYLEDATVADLFAFLLESNEARRAVAQNTDLREFIMRPVDTDEIQARVKDLVETRQELDDRIEAIEARKQDLPDLEAQRVSIEEDIQEKREELAAKEAQLEATDADVEQTRNDKQALEAKLDDLRDLRSDLEDVRYDIETEQETGDNLKTEQTELEDTKAELPDTPAGEIDEIEAQIDRLRTQKQSIESQVTELQSIISFNDELLTAGDHEVRTVIDDGKGGDVTDQLVDAEDVTCWTCGTPVATDQIEGAIDGLRELANEKMAEVDEIEAELRDRTEQRTHLEDQQQERHRVETRLAQIEDELAESKNAIESLQARRDDLTAEIEAIETEVEELEEEAYAETLERHREANQLEYDIGKLEGELEQVTDEIETIEDKVAELEAVHEERAEVQAEIEELRTRIDRIEAEAVEVFNDHMDAVLEMLDYGNLERVWLERAEQEVREGRRKVTKTAFYLHVVRQTASGTTYEDTIDHLSESEREVTGLVFALAGYLAHNVADTIPFMLLDSLEAIDSERIATMIDYFSDHTKYLVVALLPEDAAALELERQEISPT